MNTNQPALVLPARVLRSSELPSRSSVMLRSRGRAPAPITRLMQGLYYPGRPPWLDQARLALAVAGPGCVLSHTSAARCHGWGEGLPDGPLTVTQCRLDGNRCRRPEIRVTRTNMPAELVTTVQGLALTTPARTVKDVLALLGETDAVRWFEIQLEMLPKAVVDEVAEMRGRGCRLARQRMALADPASDSWLETAFRLLLKRHKVEMPESQVTLTTPAGDFVARFDFAWRRLKIAVELDGKYFHGNRRARRDDTRRDNLAAVQGWIVLRFTYAQVRYKPDEVLATMRAALVNGAAAV